MDGRSRNVPVGLAKRFAGLSLAWLQDTEDKSVSVDAAVGVCGTCLKIGEGLAASGQ